ncbi:MAG: hypothetical protein IJU25_04590, partial [Lachnospiraceae bacterium]|nr:hypothetical protein [Lachnospiraceae bacterium]
IMPGEDVKIEAEFLETKKAITGELLIRVDDSIIENKGTITIDKVGATKQLEASDTAGGRLGLWNFDFASSNPSIMTVSPMGVITGLKQGIAELSVTPTGMKAKAQKFRVEVAAPTTIRAIHFDQFLSTGADPDNPLVPQSLYDNDFTAPVEPYRNPLIPNAWVYPVGYVDQYGLGDATYYVVEYEQSTVAANAQSFKPFFIATEDADGDDGYDDTTGKYENNLYATANWTSSDPNIVKLSASKTYTNDVTINIPKGAKGTALIRATVPNDDPDFPTAGPAGFIVRIRDRSPRLYGKYTVNTNNPNGTELKLTTVYGTRIDHSTGLTVCTKTVNKKSGQVEYVESPDLRVDPDDTDPRSDPANDIAIYYIKANKTAKPQTYKDKLYLVGQYTDNGHYFYTPIPELQIVDTSVKPKLTYQSKINLFYNRSGNNAVLLRHGLNGVKIDYAKTTLISAANYPTVTGPDDLQANFEIVTAANAMNPEDAKLVSDDKVIVIKLNRTLGDQNEGLKKKGNKVVTDGVLKLWFVGYDTPFYLKVSIPVVNVVPGYVFDKVSAGASPNNRQAQFALRLVDSATKIKPLYLYEHDSKYRKADGTIDYKKEEADGKPADGDLLIADIRYNQAQTTDNLFDMDNDALLDPVFNKKDQIPIKLSATRRKNKGTAAIALRLKTWARPVTYKFTVTETKDPTMTFKPVTLNKEVVYASGIATPKINQKEWIQTGYDTAIDPDEVKKAVIEADGIDFIYTGPQTPTAIDNAAKVIDLVTLNDDFSIQFDLPAYESADWEDLVAGTYNFQVIPKGKFGDGGTVFYLGRTNLQVKVVKNKPVFRLLSASFTLNPAFAGEGDVNSEGVITKTSLTNVPAGYTYKVAQDQNLEFYKVTDVKLEHEVANPYGKFSGTDTPAPSKADPNRTLQTGVRAELDNDPPAINATYAYLVKGFTVEIWAVDENGDPTGASLGELEFAEMRVNFITKVVEPTLRVTSVGTINQIDSRSAITYTFTTNGINNGTITSMKVQELMPNNEFGPEDDPDGHFVIKPAEDKDGNEIRNTYKLTLNLNNVLGDGVNIDPVQYGQKYTLKLNYTLDETGGTAGETFTHRLTVTPSQKVAAMSLLKTSAYTYSGAVNQDFEIFVRQTSIAGAEIDDVNLNVQTPDVPAGIRILPTTGMNIKEAFTIAAVSKQYADTEGEWYYNTTEKKYMQLTDEDEAAIAAGEMAAPLSVKLDDQGKPVYDENKKPIYGFTVTLQLAHPGILPVDKYYKVPIEIRYKYQNVKTRGNVLTFVPTVYK